MAIYFYSSDESPYGCFSNFSPHGFHCEGDWWPSSEHYYQAHKHANTPQFEQVRQTPTPAEAKLRGRALPCCENWDEIKDEVMRQAVMQKFLAHPEICDRLLATGEETLIENAPLDFYWGCGADGSGQNRLGEILMEVRSQLRVAHTSIQT